MCFVWWIYGIFYFNLICNLSADPCQPTQSENIYVFKTDTKFGIQWNPPTTGRVDKYSIDVNCNCLTCCSCDPNFEDLVNKTTVNVTGLYAGTDCIVRVTAISGNLSSSPLVYGNIETTEKGNDIYNWNDWIDWICAMLNL